MFILSHSDELRVFIKYLSAATSHNNKEFYFSFIIFFIVLFQKLYLS